MLKGAKPYEGMRVGFEIEQGEKGPRARNLRIVEDGSKSTDKTEYRFQNPYNFVRYLDHKRPEKHVLGNCLPPPHDRYVGLTGRITCKAEAVTPLFISDAHGIKEENGHKSYRFFQYEGQPALPASSLRGMVRSVFETVTNSCFSVFQEDYPYPLEYRSTNALKGMKPARVVEVNKRGAKLEILELAKVSINKLPPGAEDGMRVIAIVKKSKGAYRAIEVRPASDHKELKRDEVFGWLHITGPNIENKRAERLFFRWDDRQPEPLQIHQIPDSYLYECSADVVEEYNHHLKGYSERLGEKVESLGERRELKVGDLVYALCETGENCKTVKMLRLVCVPRVRYKYCRQKFLPKHLARCSEYNNLCPACRVFGWVLESKPKKKEEKNDCKLTVYAEREGKASGDSDDYKLTAYAGRVRFSHGRITGDYETENEITLAILATPKPTATAFYLLGPSGQPDPKVTYDTVNAQLRGRKYYRHQGKAEPEEYCTPEKSEQNRTVRGVLKPGATFTFTVEFENLAPLELGALLYALELEEGMFHRLGYAKPLGFGSVKLTVENTEIIDWESRLKDITPNCGWQSVNGVKFKQDFLKEMNILYGKDKFAGLLSELRALLGSPPKLPVHYPRPGERLDPKHHPQYEWFVGNKKRINEAKKAKPKKPNFRHR